ncbi:Pumilio protein [Spraguea lophii 42_110]|uniref:Pumilio protein n=1 Tax=Spraguea lophii (strain 42_110) TaxID=1358809 RepID=S7W844_SPRLO|nr:Pumilio protein [Spraguea lophii 42_110]
MTEKRSFSAPPYYFDDLLDYIKDKDNFTKYSELKNLLSISKDYDVEPKVKFQFMVDSLDDLDVKHNLIEWIDRDNPLGMSKPLEQNNSRIKIKQDIVGFVNGLKNKTDVSLKSIGKMLEKEVKKKKINVEDIKEEKYEELNVDLDTEIDLKRDDGSVGLNGFGYLDESNLKMVVNFICKDQDGSRFIQKKIDECSSQDRLWLYENIKDDVWELSMDLFGNYVIQKLFESEREIKKDILKKVKGRILGLSVHMYGCRVVQKILECSGSEEMVLEEIKDKLLVLIEDQNGNHVVQKCVEKIKDKKYFIEYFQNHSVNMSMHKYGCRVIQRLLIDNHQDVMVKNIIDNTSLLAENQYGNYVLQFILDNGNEVNKKRIINKILPKVYEYSKHKFASNVVEKCVVQADNEERIKMVDRLNGDNIFDMSTDKFANYVVQRLIDLAENRKKIINNLKPHVAELKKCVYSKHITTKLYLF